MVVRVPAGIFRTCDDGAGRGDVLDGVAGEHFGTRDDLGNDARDERSFVDVLEEGVEG